MPFSPGECAQIVRAGKRCNFGALAALSIVLVTDRQKRWYWRQSGDDTGTTIQGKMNGQGKMT